MRSEKIGDAMLYLADCRDILPTLTSIDVVVTDPPYGVDLGLHRGASERRPGLLVKEQAYADSVEDFDNIVPPVIVRCLELTSRAAVFGVPPNLWKLPPPNVLGGVFVPGAVGRNCWGWTTLIHCALYGSAPDLNLGAKATAIYSTEIAEVTGHSATKPYGWMQWAVLLTSRRGETVLDPFMGSGTTGVACARLGRRFLGIEIDQKYFDISCRRIENAQRQRDLFIHDPSQPEPTYQTSMFAS